MVSNCLASLAPSGICGSVCATAMAGIDANIAQAKACDRLAARRFFFIATLPREVNPHVLREGCGGNMTRDANGAEGLQFDFRFA
jgi:hypothetical protein